MKIVEKPEIGIWYYSIHKRFREFGKGDFAPPTMTVEKHESGGPITVIRYVVRMAADETANDDFYFFILLEDAAKFLQSNGIDWLDKTFKSQEHVIEFLNEKKLWEKNPN